MIALCLRGVVRPSSWTRPSTSGELSMRLNLKRYDFCHPCVILWGDYCLLPFIGCLLYCTEYRREWLICCLAGFVSPTGRAREDSAEVGGFLEGGRCLFYLQRTNEVWQFPPQDSIVSSIKQGFVCCSHVHLFYACN